MENDYILRINQAINFIYTHLDQNLTAEEIADHCCFSRFYFNRMFKSVTGENVYAFIRRMKLEYAAFKLRATRKPVTEIAMESGYSPSNFATAFRAYFGISATEFRKKNRVPVKDAFKSVVEHIHTLKQDTECFKRIDSKITLKRLEPMTLIYRRFIGNYQAGLGKAWDDFCRQAEAEYVFDQNTQFIGISYDDPLIADEDHCYYDMCIRVANPKETDVLRLDGGLYACYAFHDVLPNLVKAYNEIFSLWMPNTPYRIKSSLCFEIYHSPSDENGRMMLDICIPLEND